MAAGTARPARPGSSGPGLRSLGWPFLFLAPWIIGFFVFTAGPMVASLVLSLTDYDVLNPPQFIGLANYEQLLRDRNVVASLGNTIFYTVLHVPSSMAVALGLALLLDRVRGRTANVFRTIFYLPSITPPVAIGIIFLLFLNPQIGLLGEALRAVGLRSPAFTTDPDWIKPGIVLMSLWGLGTTMVIYYTALRNVPAHLYEAAEIDGAGGWQRFRNVTLPMISSALFFTLIVNVIASLQIFAEVWTMYFGNQDGGAGERAALFYVIYLFQQAFQFLHMGYASAMAWLLFVVILVITVVQLRLSKRWVYYEGGD